MRAGSGVYTGRKDNIFWHRLTGDPARHIEAAAAQSGPRDVVPRGRDVIPSVANPTGVFTSAIHAYAGDFFAAHRGESELEGLTLQKHIAYSRRVITARRGSPHRLLQCDRCTDARSEVKCVSIKSVSFTP